MKAIAALLLMVALLTLTACGLSDLMGTTGTQTAGSIDAQTADEGADRAGTTAESELSNQSTQQSGSTAGNTAGTSTATKQIKVTLFFATPDNSAIKREERDVLVTDGAILKACVLALIEGPETEGLSDTTIPAGTVLHGISVKDHVATVDFSNEFQQAAGMAGIVARVAVVNTLTSISGIERVRFHINGEDMIGMSGMPLGEMGPTELDSNGLPVPDKVVTLTLYFGDAQAAYVVPEQRRAALTESSSLEKLVMQELMRGPETEGLYPTIPEGTVLHAISTRDGICTVDLSEEFVKNGPGGTAGERMTLDSVVDSLTALDGVQKVQFLIDGEKRKVYTHTAFDGLFSRNEAGISNP